MVIIMSIKDYLQEIYCHNLYDFSSRESCEALHQLSSAYQADRPVFSFLMCVYNDTSLLNSAINSLIKQSFTNWELLILDNSDKNPDAWTMLENAAWADSRIHCFKSDENVGWPKGSSLLLPHAKGQYTSFLSADDCINLEALSRLNMVIQQEAPDIIWVGNVGVKYISSQPPELISKNIPPEYKIYEADYRSETIVDIMKNVYYNSFFHYLRIDFLKKYHINFFEPYYADCGGMTRALTAAKKMVTLNDVIYFLTTNTSQTVGKYTWDSYQFIFAKQWSSILQVFHKENFPAQNAVQYTALRILLNFFSNLDALCQNHCRNKYMNPVTKNKEDIIQQLENILECNAIIEMLQLTEPLGFRKLTEKLAMLSKLPLNESNGIDKNSWICSLILFSLQQTSLSVEEKLQYLEDWLLQTKNTACIGFISYNDLLNSCEASHVQKHRQNIEKILQKQYAFFLTLEQSSWRKYIYPKEWFLAYQSLSSLVQHTDAPPCLYDDFT
jgi:glycosyltransferase involved in cell wall biosynthesis